MPLENPEVRPRDWVKALRSGRYTQGKGHLYNKGCFCCLGVYAILRGVSADALQNMNYLSEARLSDMPNLLNEGISFPLKVQETYGTLPKTLAYDFITLNDIVGQSFEQIAAFVEDYIEPDTWEWKNAR